MSMNHTLWQRNKLWINDDDKMMYVQLPEFTKSEKRSSFEKCGSELREMEVGCTPFETFPRSRMNVGCDFLWPFFLLL